MRYDDNGGVDTDHTGSIILFPVTAARRKVDESPDGALFLPFICIALITIVGDKNINDITSNVICRNGEAAPFIPTMSDNIKPHFFHT